MQLSFRKASAGDMSLYFEWANDPVVRANSINREQILFEDHLHWFEKKVIDPTTMMQVLLADKEPAGQLRVDIDRSLKEGLINFSVAQNYRGKGLGSYILEAGGALFFSAHSGFSLKGFVHINNLASLAAFNKAKYLRAPACVIIRGETFAEFSKNN